MCERTTCWRVTTFARLSWPPGGCDSRSYVRNLPVDRRLARGAQCRVDRGERPSAEEAVVCRKWGGMRRPYDWMSRGRDQLGFPLGGAAPQREDHRAVLLVYPADDGVGKPLPAFAAMRVWGVRSRREHGVEQQHTLFGPGDQVPVAGDRTAEVVSTARYLCSAPCRRSRSTAAFESSASCAAKTSVTCWRAARSRSSASAERAGSAASSAS